MLAKVFRHEIKSGKKPLMFLIIFTAIITLMGALSFMTPMWGEILGNMAGYGYSYTTNRINPLNVLGIFLLIGYFMSLAALSFGVYVYLGSRFFRTMFGKEGYLTHTLPVGVYDLFFGKLLSAALWSGIALLALMISMGTVGLALALRTMILNGINPIDALQKLFLALAEAESAFRDFMGMGYLAACLHYLAAMVVGSFVGPIFIFGACTLGQLVKKNKVLMSVVAFFGLNMLSQYIVSLFVMPYSMNQMQFASTGEEVGRFMLFGMWGNILVQVLIAVALAAGSLYLIRNKLNLE